MKRLYPILLAATLVAGVSCLKDNGTGASASGTKEVEINISTSGQSATRATYTTRSPLDGKATDAGITDEQAIATLDMLVFDDTGYLYRREAYKVSTGVGTYRVTLEESSKFLDVYLFANAREILQAWEAASDRVGLGWATVKTQLVDNSPARLVGQEEYEPLPMFGSKSGVKIDPTKAPTKWGNIQLLRSVASVDVYVEDKESITDVFSLTGLLAWYAPQKGYLVAIEDEDNTTPNQQYLSPGDMTSSLNGVVDGPMHAQSVSSYTVAPTTENGESESKSYTGVACQMYLYDNPFITRADGVDARPTRIIVAAQFKNEEDVWTDCYYPLDIIYEDGKYRPVIRNWKYEFKVTSVSGPGYDTPQEAAEGAPVGLNVELIPWNKDDVAIGVNRHYYVSMRTKDAILWRNAGDTEDLYLTYEMLDGGSDEFTFDFQTTTAENPQTDILEDGKVTAIFNNYFLVELTQDGDENGGNATFKITTRETMNENDGDKRTDYVVVCFRELEFVITITQFNSSEHDWDHGGDIPVDM